MTLTGTDRGTGTSGTAGLTFTVTPGSNLTAGAMAVLVIVCDNADTNGAANSTFTVTDNVGGGAGNTWTRRISPLRDPGAANAGCEGAIFTTPQNAGTLTTGSTITVTFDASTARKAAALMEVTASAGTVTYVTGTTGGGGSTATPTITTGAITSGNMVIGALFVEHGIEMTITEDGDSTDGAWATQQTTETGSTTSGVSVACQRKVVTATATQTYNPGLSEAADVVLGWIELTEVLPAAYRDWYGCGWW